MSKHKPPMIMWYWNQPGGTLIEEFPAIKGAATQGRRVLDAIILPKRETHIAHWGKEAVSLEGEEVIVVQAKKGRLGMYLMGQAFFSAQVMERFRLASVRSVALCTEDDSVLRPLLEKYPGMEVVIYPEKDMS